MQISLIFRQYDFNIVSLTHSKVSSWKFCLVLLVDKLEVKVLTKVACDKLNVKFSKRLSETDALSA